MTWSSQTCPLGSGEASPAAPSPSGAAGFTSTPKLSLFVAWQDGLQEEELGPLPVLPERNGPRVQAWLGEGGVADAGQEVLHQGQLCHKDPADVSVEPLPCCSPSSEGFRPVVCLIQMFIWMHLLRQP